MKYKIFDKETGEYLCRDGVASEAIYTSKELIEEAGHISMTTTETDDVFDAIEKLSVFGYEVKTVKE